jgi:serine phosphatase RsbU (regulator of sigma subunit)/tetratricopeptide (TPR) repeat protein
MMKLSNKISIDTIVPIVLITICSFRLFPQDPHRIDSLQGLLTSAKDDTGKVKLLYALADQYRNSKTDTAIYFLKEALEMAEKTESDKFIAECLIALGANFQRSGMQDTAILFLERARSISEITGDKKNMSTAILNIGICKHEQGFYQTAVEHYLKAIEIAGEAGFKTGEARCFNNLGIAYYDQGSYEKSIEAYLQALRINEELGEKRSMSACLNNIGIVHQEQLSFDKAIEYYEKALVLKEEIDDKRGMAICRINIGNIYNKQGVYDKAIEYYNIALEIFEETGNKKGIAGASHNIGETYVTRGDFDEAGRYYSKALALYEEIGDRMGMATTEVGIADLNIIRADSVRKGDQKIRYLNQTIVYAGRAIKNAGEMQLLPLVKEAADALMKAYSRLGNEKKALEFAGIYIAMQDSIFIKEKTRAIQEMSARYETEKKEQQIELQESQLIVKDAKIKQQRTLRNALAAGLAAVGLIVIVIAYAYRQKQKDNEKIREQNNRILAANEELKELNEITRQQNEEILSSIQYAHRIQAAVLPPESYITELLNENFIIYKPKEIVSGDFYWIRQINNYIIVASADCTGHGVPGAFMSMLGISYLNEIVARREVTQANHVLNELRKEIKHSLRQTGQKEASREGIDMALCVIDTKNNVMQFAGAYSPLYIISNSNGESVFKELKADMMPIGVHFVNDKSFTNHEIPLQIGDTFYVFTDGFIDQVGGPNNTRFSSRNLKKLLMDIHDQPMYEQKEIMEETLKEWMGKEPQRDDILIIGARI